MKTLFVGLLILLSGCATVHHLSDSESTWISVDRGADRTPYWCTVKKDGQETGPVCFEAKLLRNSSLLPTR